MGRGQPHVPSACEGAGPAGSTRAAGGGTCRLQQLLQGVRRAARRTCVAPYVPACCSRGGLKCALNYQQMLHRQGNSRRPKQRALTGAPGLSMGRSQPQLGERGAARVVTDAAAAALCPALSSAAGAEQSLTHSTGWMCLSGLVMVRQGKGGAASQLGCDFA